jgi:hypothetical protein
MGEPRRSVSPNVPDDAETVGMRVGGTSSWFKRSSSQRRSKMLYISVREAFV